MSQAPTTLASVPRHIAIVMDGNGRWAKKQNMPRTYGHKKGVEVLKDTVKSLIKYEITSLTVYAFSTENWKRPPKEVKYLMGLFSQTIEREAAELDDQGIKINIIGRRAELDQKILKKIEKIENLTENNDKLILNIAFNYGGRAEIIDVIKKLKADKNLKPEEINQKLVSKYLYNPTISDIEFIIRTGGDKRISNFLLWESAYAELYFTDKYWPEFDEKELNKALKSFAIRQRKFGALTGEADQ